MPFRSLGFRRGVHDDLGHRLRLREHRHVARVELGRRRLHALREEAFFIGRDRFVELGHDVPRRLRLATPDTWAPKAETLMGLCVAAATRAASAGRSDAKSLNASVGRVMKPCGSTMGDASARGDGYALPSSLTASPSSGPKAAT